MFIADEQEEEGYETDTIKMCLKCSQGFTVCSTESYVQTSLWDFQKPGKPQ